MHTRQYECVVNMSRKTLVKMKFSSQQNTPVHQERGDASPLDLWQIDCDDYTTALTNMTPVLCKQVQSERQLNQRLLLSVWETGYR